MLHLLLLAALLDPNVGNGPTGPRVIWFGFVHTCTSRPLHVLSCKSINTPSAGLVDTPAFACVPSSTGLKEMWRKNSSKQAAYFLRNLALY